MSSEHTGISTTLLGKFIDFDKFHGCPCKLNLLLFNKNKKAFSSPKTPCWLYLQGIEQNVQQRIENISSTYEQQQQQK